MTDSYLSKMILCHPSMALFLSWRDLSSCKYAQQPFVTKSCLSFSLLLDLIWFSTELYFDCCTIYTCNRNKIKNVLIYLITTTQLNHQY